MFENLIDFLVNFWLLVSCAYHILGAHSPLWHFRDLAYAIVDIPGDEYASDF